jgi:hypothetical protein
MSINVKKERLRQFEKVLLALEEQNRELQKQNENQKEALSIAMALLLDLNGESDCCAKIGFEY